MTQSCLQRPSQRRLSSPSTQEAKDVERKEFAPQMFAKHISALRRGGMVPSAATDSYFAISIPSITHTIYTMLTTSYSKQIWGFMPHKPLFLLRKRKLFLIRMVAKL